MKEIITQYTGKAFVPFSVEDAVEAANEYKVNELVKAKTTHVGAKKEPSVVQNNLVHACLKLVADNTTQFKTLEQVKFACKVDIHFVEENMVHVKKDGSVQFQYRSFSFKELGHMERNRIFERVFDWCSNILGITVDELIAEAKSKMQRRYK